MSRKAPKNYGKAANKPSNKTTATPEEERQARRVINGIAIGLLAIMVIAVAAFWFSK